MSISLGNQNKGHFNINKLQLYWFTCIQVKYMLLLPLRDFFPSPSTLDTFLTMLLNCNLAETCMLNHRGSLLSNLWKCTREACVSCRVHLHLSRYSSTLGNWLLIAAINMWWLSASNSCSISTVQFDVTTHSFSHRWLAEPLKIVLFLMI